MALLGQLVGHLEQGEGAGHAVEVLAHRAEVVDHLRLVHHVEVAAPLPEQQGHVAERLEAGPELAPRAPHPLGHRPHLAVVLGEQDDDPVGLAQAVGAQHHPPVAKQAHRPPAPVSGPPAPGPPGT